ncbi:hypothetical protein [Chamaesiphon minutus]|uniref:Uncharacterized protein n=1 Tax=Chamaesiphon minutus (strain ATCC 27169 / PCC 6605) TaxID=1173020 RepID=K9U8U9_CHAP6|nr:hypothetical protein [Chamaesiphon minutus]AFY91512.1 hypothetical protein Cha6605_0210 [Chamaesiphon minutus PCC 6605]
MLNYERFLTSYPTPVDFDNLPLTPGVDSGCIDIDDESSGGIRYKLTTDKLTGLVMPQEESERMTGMESDGSFQTPNGIRYKVFNRIEIDGTEYIQYIQPDGREAIPGEAIKLPNGEVYRGKNNNILYQQEPMLSEISIGFYQGENNNWDGQEISLSEETMDVERPGQVELKFIGIDEMDFNFGFDSDM